MKIGKERKQSNSRKGKWKICFMIIVIICLYQSPVYGAQTEGQLTLDDYNFSEIEQQLGEQEDVGFSFREMVSYIMSGNITKACQLIGKGIWNSLMEELIGNKKLMIQIICVAIFSSIFVNFSHAFSAKNVGESGFFVTYLILFSILATSYGIGVSMTTKAVKQLLEFMKVLIPAFCISVTTASGFTGSSGIYGVLMLAVMAVDYLILKVLLPFANLYFVLQMVDNLGNENHFSKFAQIVKSGCEWSMKTLFVGIAGVQVLQSLILPAIDSVKGTVVQKGVSLIPGAGQAVSAVLSTMLGAGVIIKNSIGVAGLLCILALVSLPIIKLTVFCISYQVLAALLQPISDKRMMNCIQGTGDASSLLLKLIWMIAGLFMVSLALAAASTNAVYYSQI